MNIATITKNPTSSPGPNRIDDARLPLLVSQSAIEFDCALRGLQDVRFEAATKLGEVLISFSGKTQRSGGNSDPIAVGLVALAMQNVEIPDLTIANFADQTAEMGALLANTSTSSAKWTALRDFCVSFALQLVEYRQSIKLMQPENPNRR